jgi:hypothetical protein
MEFAEKIQQFADRSNKIADDVKTEEATKASLVMPFFQMLGYDIFNPKEFIPEYTADVGIKKGEKVDYAIIVDGCPLILIECKPYGDNLDRYTSQLFRYYSTVPDAKFAILTDGITYRFYTDFERENILDDRPFLEFSLTQMKDSHLNEIAKFQKNKLDVNSILDAAETMMYTTSIREWLTKQFMKPDDEFIRHILFSGEIYKSKLTQKAIDNFRPLIESSIEQFQVDLLNARFRSAMKDTSAPIPAESDTENEPEEVNSSKEITIEEIEAFAIVKSILHDVCDVNKLTLRPTADYVVVDYQGNSWKRIIRFWFSGKKKFVTTPDENKVPVRFDIDNLNDLYKLSDRIREVCERYL